MMAGYIIEVHPLLGKIALQKVMEGQCFYL